MSEDKFRQRREAGNYRLELEFPGGVLAQNSYSVNVSVQFVDPQKTYLIKLRNAFEFKGLHGSQRTSERPVALITRSAMVDPPMNWNLAPTVVDWPNAPAPGALS